MRYSTYRFTLDLQKHQSQISIAVFQYDTAVRLYISLTDGGIPYHIADGCRAVFYGKRPDGKDLVHNCMIEGNTRIIYDFNDQTACCEGTVDAQICLYGIDGNLITAPKLLIVASARTVNPTDIVIPDKPLSALDQIFASETERETAELERVEAEKQRGREAQKWVTGSYIDENGDAQNVTSEDPQFENNAVYYAGKAAESAESAETAAEAANNVLSTVNNRLDNVDYILEQFGAVKAQVDSSAALVKSIPARSDFFAYLNSVGGKTEKYNQLLTNSFWYFGDTVRNGETIYHNGGTIKNNGDGTYTFNGTFSSIHLNLFISTKDYNRADYKSLPVLPDGAPACVLCVSLKNNFPADIDCCFNISVRDSVDEDGTFVGDLSGDLFMSILDKGRRYGNAKVNKKYISTISFSSNKVTLNNYIFAPMFNHGTTPLPWQPPAEKQLLNLPEGAGTGYYFWHLAEGSNFGQQLNEKITTVKDGVTIVNNGDGSFTLNGTATNSFNFALFSVYNWNGYDEEQFLFGIPNPKINAYISFGGASLPDGVVLRVTSDDGSDEGYVNGCFTSAGGTFNSMSNTGAKITSMVLVIESETTFNNLTIKPMLNYGTTPHPWQSPANTYAGLRSGKVTALKVYGSNLFDFNEWFDKHKEILYGTSVVEPLTNGFQITTNVDGSYVTSDYKLKVLPDTVVSVMWDVVSGTNAAVYMFVNGSDTTALEYAFAFYDKGILTKTMPSNAEYIVFRFLGAGIVPTVYRNIRVAYTDHTIPYSPYKEPTTYDIPLAVQDISGYGEGNPYNASEYNTVDFENQIFTKKGAISSGEWESFTTPEVTDISVELGNFDPVIPVEGEGRIEFVNQYNYDVPSTITYNIIQEAAI